MKFYLVKADTWDIGVKGIGRCPVYFEPPLSCIVEIDVYSSYPRIQWHCDGGGMSGDGLMRLFGGYRKDIAIDIWSKIMGTYKRSDGDLIKVLDKYDNAHYSREWENHNRFFIETWMTKKGKGYHEWYLEIDVSGDIDEPTYTLTEHTLKNVHYYVDNDNFMRQKITEADLPKYKMVQGDRRILDHDRFACIPKEKLRPRARHDDWRQSRSE